MSDEAGPAVLDDELNDQFKRASTFARTGLKKTSTADQLLLYAHYKQVTVGDCTGSRPGFLYMTERSKWDAWNQVRGMPSAAAAHAYVEIVTRLAPDWEAQEPPAAGIGDSGGGGDAEAKSMGPVQSTLYVVEDTVADSDKTAFNYVEDGDLNGLTQALATETAQGNSGALVAQTDDSGMTLLHWASDRGHVEICRYLIDNAADVNAVDAESMSPLHYASVCDHDELIEILLAAGADASLKDKDGLTPAETRGS
eukprot:m.251071 g.251071  ORF g.251071 m.251071 type:complete len:254 (-) comp15894_c1_seq1:133-894(-)